MAGGQVRIDEMYAFVQLDPEDDTEGIVAFFTGMGWMPMVGADLDRVESLRPMAEGIAKETGSPVKLLRFSVREEVEELKPDG